MENHTIYNFTYQNKYNMSRGKKFHLYMYLKIAKI